MLSVRHTALRLLICKSSIKHFTAVLLNKNESNKNFNIFVLRLIVLSEFFSRTAKRLTMQCIYMSYYSH